MKGKIVESSFFPEIGMTKVVKATKYGTFRYVALCSAEDIDCLNEWDGYTFCEYQCDIQALKEKIKRMTQRFIGMKQMFYNFVDSAEVDEDGNFVEQTGHDAMWDFMYSVSRQIELDKQKLKQMEEQYPEFVEHTLQERKEFQKKYMSENEE